MGMFNWVNYQMNCPECGHLVTGFQTKDESLVSLYLENVEINQIGKFYSECDNCGLWIEFILKRPPNITIDDFEMKTTRFNTKEEWVILQEKNKKATEEFWEKVKDEKSKED